MYAYLKMYAHVCKHVLIYARATQGAKTRYICIYIYIYIYIYMGPYGAQGTRIFLLAPQWRADPKFRFAIYIYIYIYVYYDFK